MNNLINLLDNCRYWNNPRKPFFNRIYYYQVVNTIINALANIILPLYFILSNKNENYQLIKSKVPDKNKPQIIVSLTSFPARIDRLWLVIECMFRQTLKPDRIILYLTEAQVGSINSLPDSLLKLRLRGLEIVLCPDQIRSHTKYYYAMKQNPNDVIITIDDDIFYKTDFIESLVNIHKCHPNKIVANWVKEISSNSHLYANWKDVYELKELNNFILLGVGGVLYPPKCMYKDIFEVDLIKELSLTADDVWLSAMAMLNKTEIVSTDYKMNHLSVSFINNETLLSENRSANQVQIDKINDFYYKKIEIRPFIDLVTVN